MPACAKKCLHLNSIGFIKSALVALYYSSKIDQHRRGFLDALNQISTTLALRMGLAWASGINLYATLLTLGFLANSGNIMLPPA